jgi:hypothetical protein
MERARRMKLITKPCEDGTGTTGLEPATSGVTGRYALDEYNWLRRSTSQFFGVIRPAPR